MTSTTTKHPAKYSREMLEEEIHQFLREHSRNSTSWGELRLPAPDTTINTPEGPAPAWKRKTVGAMFVRWLSIIGGRGCFLRINPETFTLELVDCSFEKRGKSRYPTWVNRVHGVEVKP